VISEPLPVSLHLLSETQFPVWIATQGPATQSWLKHQQFKPERGRWLAVPDASGGISCIAAGLGQTMPDASAMHWLAAALADKLPAGDYQLATPLLHHATQFAVGWGVGGYLFGRYRSGRSTERARLQMPPGVDRNAVAAAVSSNALARNLINTPANDMGPAELEAAALAVAESCGGILQVTQGEALTAQFPLVAAVGQGSSRAPRLLDLHFQRPNAPQVILVGKGVCFDTGGLDIKPSAGMLLMKKDMGGAAVALATAQLLRQLNVPIDLRVLIPAVENSVDGNSFRPGDVWRSRKGLTVEITNTDAEGRLVLADALTAAAERTPDLIIDFATLTGAARVALGPELPPVFGGDTELVNALVLCGTACADPLWSLPLWDGYEEDLSSRIADLNNAPAGGMAGAITGALFLRRFVTDPKRWLHLDIYGWNAKDRPGRPVGAEAHGVRAVAAFLQQRYG
jgi:leucyl aminopeptidase